mmetsp:Transcript_15357/g.51708  ORF Transcript_15357/g.51708 Transcript_15357/m.51708 type:complete len:183 (-) Transcript_15357:97-645(-)
MIKAGAKERHVSLSSFAYIFCEVVQYQTARIQTASDLERRLEEMGHAVGVRVLELVAFRERQTKRELRVIGILQFVSSVCWRALFGKAADSLERSTESDHEYMIHESEPATNRFISVPPDLGQLNCAAYIAGVIAGILESANFPAECTAHTVSDGPGMGDRTVFLIKFTPEVMAREAALAGG